MDATLYSSPVGKFSWLSPDQFSSKFRELWDRSAKSFEKVECCPVFVEDDDASFDLFSDGKFVEARRVVGERVRRQVDMYRDLLDRGGHLVRYRVVGRPLTPYIAEYEMAAYEAASTIGEQVRFVSESAISPDIQLLCRDMLVFDRSAVLIHAYTPWGRMIGGYYSEDAADLKLVRSVLEELSAMSTDAPTVR